MRQTEYTPVSARIGHSALQVSTHMSRPSSGLFSPALRWRVGPSLKRCRFEYVASPNRTPKQRNETSAIVYSVHKRPDFGTSLALGPYRETHLATLIRLLRSNPDRGTLLMVDARDKDRGMQP